jgi:hypothetical protein
MAYQNQTLVLSYGPHLVNSVSVWSDMPLSVAVGPNLRVHWDRVLLGWVSCRTSHHNSLMPLLGSVASLRPSLARFFTPFSNVLTPKVSQLQVSQHFHKHFQRAFYILTRSNAYAMSQSTKWNLGFKLLVPISMVWLSILSPIAHSIASWPAKQNA